MAFLVCVALFILIIVIIDHGYVADGFERRPHFRSFSSPRPFSQQQHQQLHHLQGKKIMMTSASLPDLKVVTYNILAPCYKRLPSDPSSSAEKRFESEAEEQFLSRNREICEKLLRSNADIICLQEFWTGSPALRELFEDMLCKKGNYEARYVERSSHWRSRKDGLAMFVKRERLVIEDVRDIYFHDCGDRVALMLVLGLLPPPLPHSPAGDAAASSASSTVLQRFICINTHLLFPHNESSRKIRLREVTKLLGFVEAYKQRELCQGVCNRSDVRLPVILAGDFNGSPRGQVYQYIRSQNFQSALEDYQHHSSHHSDVEDKKKKWISHLDHRGRHVAVDHIFYLNPSRQTADHLGSLPDWTNLVYCELLQRLLEQNRTLRAAKEDDSEVAEKGNEDKSGGQSTEEKNRWGTLPPAPLDLSDLPPTSSTLRAAPVPALPLPANVLSILRQHLRDLFFLFDQDRSDYITEEEFRFALQQLGFRGEDSPALTDEEVQMIIRSADKNQDGMIDYKEFCDRFWLAIEMLSTVDPKKESLMLHAQRFAYARSQWLTQPPSTSPRNGLLTEGEGSGEERLSWSKAVALGDLSVCQAQLEPRALLQGDWPEDYQLSDHGMLSATFALSATAPVT
eukprot:gene3676-4022_t